MPDTYASGKWIQINHLMGLKQGKKKENKYLAKSTSRAIKFTSTEGGKC